MGMGRYKMQVKSHFQGCKGFSRSIPYGRVADFIEHPYNPYNYSKIVYFQLNLFVITNN
jgi:hypothetical protein